VLGSARGSWAAVSLADKLDTLVGLFLAGERPTGSRDPFGLRRAAHGILRLLLDAETLVGRPIRTPLSALVTAAADGYPEPISAQAVAELSAFLTERLQFALEARGADRRNIRSVLPPHRAALDLAVADVAENLKGLAEFSRSAQFRVLATAFKRVRNIAREMPEGGEGEWRSNLKEAAELALAEEIDRRRPAIEAAARDGRNFRAAYAEAAGFEAAVARFFNEVFVMTDDQALRHARLRLMKQLESLVLQLGDISELVAPESET
jgi:glycyl-tRNA synthetase beta chain